MPKVWRRCRCAAGRGPRRAGDGAVPPLREQGRTARRGAGTPARRTGPAAARGLAPLARLRHMITSYRAVAVRHRRRSPCWRRRAASTPNARSRSTNRSWRPSPPRPGRGAVGALVPPHRRLRRRRRHGRRRQPRTGSRIRDATPLVLQRSPQVPFGMRAVARTDGGAAGRGVRARPGRALRGARGAARPG